MVRRTCLPDRFDTRVGSLIDSFSGGLPNEWISIALLVSAT